MEHVQISWEDFHEISANLDAYVSYSDDYLSRKVSQSKYFQILKSIFTDDVSYNYSVNNAEVQTKGSFNGFDDCWKNIWRDVFPFATRVEHVGQTLTILNYDETKQIVKTRFKILMAVALKKNDKTRLHFEDIFVNLRKVNGKWKVFYLDNTLTVWKKLDVKFTSKI